MKESIEKPVKLIILDPGHFHAALMQKEKIHGVDEEVEVFAPDGPEVYGYLSLIENYNKRKNNPTAWRTRNYIGPDYLQQMLANSTGNLVVLAGNNKKKAENILAAATAGLDVLSDKPMCINAAGFKTLKAAFACAESNGSLIYDVMTARYEWYNVVISQMLQSGYLGEINKGTRDQPAITLHSTHYFRKSVSGHPLIRPAWYFDTEQQGAGIVDVTTHLTDLVQWFTQPEHRLTPQDVRVFEASQWATVLTREAYLEITQQQEIPSYLHSATNDGFISVFANGAFSYYLKDIAAKIGVEWKYKPINGESDAFSASIFCNRGTIHVVQDRENDFNANLVVDPVGEDVQQFARGLQRKLMASDVGFSDVSVTVEGGRCRIGIPEKEKLTHEAQFNRVVQQFLQYRSAGRIPDWELGFILTKYYTLQQALRLSTVSHSES